MFYHQVNFIACTTVFFLGKKTTWIVDGMLKGSNCIHEELQLSILELKKPKQRNKNQLTNEKTKKPLKTTPSPQKIQTKSSQK